MRPTARSGRRCDSSRACMAHAVGPTRAEQSLWWQSEIWLPRGHNLLIHIVFITSINTILFGVAPLQIMTLDRVRALGYKHPRPHHPPKARTARQGLWLGRHACARAEQVRRGALLVAVLFVTTLGPHHLSVGISAQLPMDAALSNHQSVQGF